MKKILSVLVKISLVLAVLGLIALGLGTWALKRYLPPEKLRELVTTHARKALQREVSIGGISVGIVRGLVVEKIAVSESPDFKAGRFAEAESFALRLRLMPLLRGKIEVDKISADGLKVAVVRKPDGTFNFSDLSGSTCAAKAPASASGLPMSFSLSVNKAALSRSQVSYQDPAAKQDWRLSEVNADIEDFSLDGPFAADLDLKAAGRVSGKPLNIALGFSGKVNLGNGRPERMSAVIKRLRIEESGRELRLSGKVLGLAAAKFDVTAGLRLSGVEILAVEAKGVATSTAARPAGSIALKLNTPGFDPEEARLSELIGAKLPKGLRVPPAQLEGRFQLSGEELTLDGVKARTKLGHMEAAGRVLKIYSGKPEPDLKLSVHLDVPRTIASDVPGVQLPKGMVIPQTAADAQLRIKPWEATFSSLRVKTAILQLEASGTVADLLAKRPRPQGLKVKAHMDLLRTKASDAPWLNLPTGLVLPATAADADISLQNWDLNLASLRVKAEGADVEASGLIRDLLGKPKPQDFKAKISLNLPRMKASDLPPILKLPAGLVIPAAAVQAALRLSGDDVTLDGIHLKTQAGFVDAKGSVRGALAGKPEPDLAVSAKLDVPAFKSADLPLPQVPPGLAVPASRWELDAAGGLESLEIKRLRLRLGKNDLEVSGTLKSARGKDPALDLMLKCRSFVLDELTPIAPQTRELKLAGSGFFALGVSGPLSKPVLSGKLKFSGLGASVAGLPLSEFTGTASFDERRIDIPKLAGKVADGVLNMDLTVKNYRAEPFLDLEASLDRFDLGKFLAAKAAVSAQTAQAQPKAKEKPKATAAPLSARGRFNVGELIHPNVSAKDVRLSWELDGIAAELKSLDGWAKVAVAGGNFNNLGNLASQSMVVKVLTLPLMVIQKIGGIGGLRIFPDFNNIAFTEIGGDYAFAKGLMTLKDTHLASDAAQVEAGGTIDLPSEKLDLVVTAQVGRVAPMDIEVTGTFAKPSAKPRLGKFLADPAKNLIKNILERPARQQEPSQQGQ